MGRQAAVVLYVVALAAVVVGVDVLFFTPVTPAAIEKFAR